MSSGRASHKGGGTKHSHDTQQLDSAATTPAANPEALLEEGDGYPFDAQGSEKNPAATERPQGSQDSSTEQNQRDQ